VSKDKDLRQIVSEHIKLYDAQEDKILDAAAVAEKYGYTPAQAIDVQALMGDKVDNVPGIPGVGEKTAVELIRQFGTAEEVVRRASEIHKPKLRENVAKHASMLPISKQLVTLKDDVPFNFDPESCRFTGLNSDAVRRHCENLGFRTLAAKVSSLATIAAPEGLSGETSKAAAFSENLFAAPPTQASTISVADSKNLAYECVDTEEKLQKLARELRNAEIFAFDTETTGLDPLQSRLVGMSFSTRPETGFYVPVLTPQDMPHVPIERVLKVLAPILEDPSIKKTGHNLKYDLLAMRHAGVHVRGIADDTMITAFLLDAARSRFGIDALALEMLSFRKIPTTDLIGSGKRQITMDRVELPLITRYAAEDADIALRLHLLFKPRLDALPEIRKLHAEVEIPLIDVLTEMEHTGITVDPAVLKQQSDVLVARIADLREQIMKSAGTEFNPDSPKQLAEVLFTKLGLRATKKTKTGMSTDVQVLEKLAVEHPVPKLILEYRSLVKLKNTYLDALPERINPQTRRVHTSFSQIGAATGRLSSYDPNLQNIPIRTDEGRRIRLAFVPANPTTHVLMSADYSQIELRMLAHLSKEPALVRAFENDEDIHKAVAAEVFHVPISEVTRQQRDRAKTINFGIIYGITAVGLSRRIDGLTVQDADALIRTYNQRFPGIERFMNDCVEHARVHGYVTTILGRRRPLPDIRSGVVAIRNANERQAINSVVQGSAADLIKVAMINIHRKLTSENRPSKMLLQVHDELVFETPIDAVADDSEFVRREMSGAMKLTVGLKVEVGCGTNWGEVK
jgi:DNA polymerase-1